MLRRAVSEAVWASASRQLGFHPRAHRRPDDLDQRLQPRHVPQLFWAEDYQREIAELFDFDDFTHWHGRRFCSVLLARMLTPLDWDAAVRYLDFPERFINEGYNTTFAKLRTNGRFDELVHRVKRIANQHAERELIDYKQRRAQTRRLGPASTSTAGSCCNPAHDRPPLAGRHALRAAPRRAVAVVPAHQRPRARRADRAADQRGLSDQTQFIRDSPPDLRDRLLILGELLLATPADARSTLHDRLAAALHAQGYLAESYYLDTIDPLITDRVLAHVSAHTGVDIPSLTTPSVGSHAPPAVTHARLLAARLLRRTARVSWTAIAASHRRRRQPPRRQRPPLPPHARARRAPRRRSRPPPRGRGSAGACPRQRLRAHRTTSACTHIAIAIKAERAELLSASHGEYVARCTSISLCRDHTDLTCYDIADIHNVNDAQPSFSHATVVRHRRADPDFEHRYRQLLDHARQLQRQPATPTRTSSAA